MRSTQITGVVAALTFALTAMPLLAEAGHTANFSTGDRVVIAQKVNVRANANGTIIGKQLKGALGTLIDGPINKNGYTWWKVDYDSGADGWTAEDFMQKPQVPLDPTVASAPVTSQTAVAANAVDNSALVAQLQSQIAALVAQIQTLKAAQGTH